jgi:hypothetical protein
MIATERIYVDASGRIVPEGDPAAAFLLAAPGDEYDHPEVAEPAALAEADEPTVETADGDADEVKVPEAPARKGRTRKAPAEADEA